MHLVSRNGSQTLQNLPVKSNPEPREDSFQRHQGKVRASSELPLGDFDLPRDGCVCRFCRHARLSLRRRRTDHADPAVIATRLLFVIAIGGCLAFAALRAVFE